MKAEAPAKHELDPIETASQDEIAALQLERMKWSVRHAYDNVSYYRDAFGQAGVHPDDLKDLADLSLFPFTVKDDLRRSYPFGMFAVPREKVTRIHASSGTTGIPTVVGYTAADIDNWSDLMARSTRAAGGRPGDIVHVAYGYGLFTGGLGAHYGAERLGCTVIPMSGGQTARQVQLIQDFRPDYIIIDESLSGSDSAAIHRHLIEDPRAHGSQIVLASATRNTGRELPNGVCASIRMPFTSAELRECLRNLNQSFFVERPVAQN